MAKRKGRARARRSPLRRGSRRERGTVLPVILALTIGVGALTTGYVMRSAREHGREGHDRDSTRSLYDAWTQMETVARMVNSASYDASGRNTAMLAAIARADGQFIDTDGWPTNVVATEEGGSGSGFYNVVSTATVGNSTTRVSALLTERQSFADFNYFVNSHPLGISGGQSAVFPYVDAPEGSIHSNDRLIFYFGDRHFRDAVSAVNGFEYTAGARGPNDSAGQNNWFHGPMNDHVGAISGLTDVDIAGFAARSDNLLALTGDHDFAKVKLQGNQALVEHWQSAHYQLQTVMQWQAQYRDETRTRRVADYGYRQMTVPVNTPIYGTVTVPVYRTVNHHDLVTAAWTETVTVPNMVQQLVTAAWTETRTGTRQVQRQVWVSGGGGGDTGGGGGGGGVGYWQTQWVTETYTYPVYHPAVYRTVQQGTKTQTINHPAVYRDWVEYVQTGTRQRRVITGYNTTYTTQNVWTVVGYHDEQYTVRVFAGWQQVPVQQYVLVPAHKVRDHTLAADGTVYVKGDIYFQPMSTGAGDPYDIHVLDGTMTFASDATVYLQDSIVYGKRDANNVLQTAYSNGADHTQPYVPNDQYRGASILGIVANQDVIYTGQVPDQMELNGTVLAKNGSVRVEGVSIASDGTVSPTSGGWVKMSLRRLGGMTTDDRPCSAYVDSSNAITRGFVFGKSVYDVRQRTTPPRGFPTLNRPRVLAVVSTEVH